MHRSDYWSIVLGICLHQNGPNALLRLRDSVLESNLRSHSSQDRREYVLNQVASSRRANSTSIRPWCAVVVVVLGMLSTASAQPALSVASLGANGDGNLQWRVDIAPDVSLFTNESGSLAAEVGFDLVGSTFLSATINESIWPFETPGNNPFTNSVTPGLSLMSTEAFVSLGSDPVTEIVELLTFTTQGGSPTTLNWGGHQILAGQLGEFEGGRLAQAGLHFDGVAGSLSAGEVQVVVGDCNGDGMVDASDLTCACGPGVIGDVLAATGLLAGDLDGNGAVAFADFLVLSNNFGAVDVGYGGGDINCDGSVGFADFLILSDGFGKTSEAASEAASVPEPDSSVLLLLFATGTCALNRRRSSRN